MGAKVNVEESKLLEDPDSKGDPLTTNVELRTLSEA